jgi:hypothetical protein
MKCQVSGCKKKANKFSKRDVLNCGIYLKNSIVWHCGNHSEEDLDKVYDSFAEEVQMVNPMIEVKKDNKN